MVPSPDEITASLLAAGSDTGNPAEAAFNAEAASERGLPVGVVASLDNADKSPNYLTDDTGNESALRLAASSPTANGTLHSDKAAPKVAAAINEPDWLRRHAKEVFWRKSDDSLLQEVYKANGGEYTSDIPLEKVISTVEGFMFNPPAFGPLPGAENLVSDPNRAYRKRLVPVLARLKKQLYERQDEVLQSATPEDMTAAKARAEEAKNTVVRDTEGGYGFSFGSGLESAVRSQYENFKDDVLGRREFRKSFADFVARYNTVMAYAADKYPALLKDARSSAGDGDILLRRIHKETGIRTDDIPPAYLQKKVNIDMKNLVDLFGTSSMSKFLYSLGNADAASADRAAKIGADVTDVRSVYNAESTYNDRKREAFANGRAAHFRFADYDVPNLLDAYAGMAEGARGEKWYSQVVNGIMTSLRYAMEIGLTGGTAEIGGVLAEQGIKGVSMASAKLLFSKAGVTALTEAGKRIALNSGVKMAASPYLLSHIAEASDDRENIPSVYYETESGEIREVPREIMTDFADRFLRATIRDFISVSTESLGELLPEPEFLKIENWMTKGARVRMAASIINRTPNASARFMDALRKAGVNGFTGEFAEEVIEKIAAGSVTTIGRSLGIAAMDLGDPGIIMNGGEMGQTAAVLLGQQALMGLAGSVLGVAHARGAESYSLLSRQSEIADAIRQTGALKSSVAAGEAVINESGTPLAGIRLELPADKAAELLFKYPDAAAVLGLTVEGFDAAEANGTTVQYSNARLIAMMGTGSYDEFSDEVRKSTLNLEDPRLLMPETATAQGADALLAKQMETASEREAMKEKAADMIRNMARANPALRIDADAVGRLFALQVDYLARNSMESAETFINSVSMRVEKDPSILQNPADLVPVGQYLLTDTPEARKAVEELSNLLGVKTDYVARLITGRGNEARGRNAEGRITISESTGQLYGVFGHEVGHEIWRNDLSLAKKIYDIMKKNSTDKARDLLTALAEVYRAENPNAKEGDELTSEEHFCELLGYMVQDTRLLQSTVEELERRKAGDGALFLWKVWDAITRALDAIKKAFASFGEDTKTEAREQVEALFDNYGENVLAPVSRMMAQYIETSSTNGIDTGAKHSLVLPQRRSTIILPANGTFAGGQQAVIDLMAGATDADFVHDTAVWLYAMMNDLVSRQKNGQDTDPAGIIEADLDTIDAWIDRQPYNGSGNEQDRADFKREKFSEAFTRYILNGKAPNAEVAEAFSLLKRGLRGTYRMFRARNFMLPPDVEAVLGTMLTASDAVDYGTDYKAVMSYIREQAAKGWLGGSADEMLRLVAGAEEQTVREQEARLRALIAQERHAWKEQAEAIADTIPAIKAMEGIKDLGGIPQGIADALFVRGSDLRKILSSRRLVAKKGKANINKLARLATRCGYSSIESMMNDISESKTRAAYVDDIVSARMHEWLDQKGFLLDEKALANDSMMAALDKLEDALLKGLGGKKMQRAFMRSEAARRLGRMTIGDVLGSRAYINAATRSVDQLVKRLGRKSPDYAGALESLGEIRIQLETLRQKSAMRDRIEKASGRIKRAIHAKAGTIDGDYQSALRELAFCNGLTSSDPGTGSQRRNAIRSAIEAEASNEDSRAMGVQMLSFADSVYSDEVRTFKSLSVDDFMQLDDFSAWLEGAGRDLVSMEKGAFRERTEAGIEGVVGDLSGRLHKYNREKEGVAEKASGLSQQARSWGRKLWRDMEEAGETLKGYYSRLSMAASQELELLDKVNKPLASALNELYDLTKDMDMTAMPELPQDSQGPRKWTPEMAVMAVLYMGTESGRQRLMDGFRWRDEEDSRDDSELHPILAGIASMLPAKALERINDIWKILGSGELTEAVKAEFRKENHFDLETLPPAPFTVVSSDGKTVDMAGGYVPIRYMYSKGCKEVKQGYVASPTYQDAAGTYSRLSTYRTTPPLKLATSNLIRHVTESAQYATHRMLLRELMRVLTSNRVKTAYGETMSYERYDSMMSLVRHVANPSAVDGNTLGAIETSARNAMVAGALMLNVKSVLSQITSASVGLGKYHIADIASGLATAVQTIFDRRLFREVLEKSALLRHRWELKDIDLKDASASFGKSAGRKALDKFAAAGYYMMKWTDMRVAIMDFITAYKDALAEGKSEREAVAMAEEFVARAQGGARPIDLMPIQLTHVGRLMTPFMSAVGAQQNLAAHDMFDPETTFGEKVLATSCNLIAPAILMAVIAYALKGGWRDDDDDVVEKAKTAAIRELVTQPFAGIPVFRDLADFVVARKTGSYTADPFEISALATLSDISVSAVDAFDATMEGDFDFALYKAADIVSSLLGIPVVKIYERQRRLLENNGFEILPDPKEELKD